jgi:outer membrane receptor for ferrienterochelin and colicins
VSKALRFSIVILIQWITAVSQAFSQDTGDLSLDSLLVMKISTASKNWETEGEAPASVTVVTSDIIQKFGFTTLADVLSSVRSFYISYDRNYSYVGIRGFSRPTDYNDRILLLVNGHTVNEGFYGTSPFGTDFALDLYSVDRIEIVRGPGSALYGSGALFAVVNVITKTGGSFDKMQVGADGGSYGTVRGSFLAGHEFSSGIDAIVSARWSHVGGQDLYFSEYDAPESNGGIARGLDWDRSYGLFSSVAYRGWSVQGMMSWREKGVPTGSFGTVFNDPRARTLDRYGFVDAAFESEIAHDKHLMVRGYYDDYYYAGAYPYDVLQQDENTVRRLGGEFQLRWDLSSGNRLTTGMEYANLPRADYHSWDAAKTFFNGNFPYSIYSLYMQDEFQLARSLSVTAGIRRDAYSRAGSSLTPRGGIVFHPGEETTLKLLFGQAFRAPSIYETDYQDQPSGFKSNHSLSPERIQTEELVWEQRLADEYLSTFSLFHNRIDGLIDQVIDPSDSLLQFRNISRARSVGVECELTARLRSGLTGYVSYSHQITTDVETGLTLTNSPTDLVKAGVSYAPVDFVQAAFDAGYETGRLTVQGTATDPFFLANVRLAVHMPSGGTANLPGWLERLQLSLLVRNVFDVKYATPGGFEHLQRSIGQDRRNYLISFAFTL